MQRDYGLAMDLADLAALRDYFRSEQRDPTMTELRVVEAPIGRTTAATRRSTPR